MYKAGRNTGQTRAFLMRGGHTAQKKIQCASAINVSINTD